MERYQELPGGCFEACYLEKHCKKANYPKRRLYLNQGGLTLASALSSFCSISSLNNKIEMYTVRQYSM
jgi:hypothetical protein